MDSLADLYDIFIPGPTKGIDTEYEEILKKGHQTIRSIFVGHFNSVELDTIDEINEEFYNFDDIFESNLEGALEYNQRCDVPLKNEGDITEELISKWEKYNSCLKSEYLQYYYVQKLRYYLSRNIITNEFFSMCEFYGLHDSKKQSACGIVQYMKKEQRLPSLVIPSVLKRLIIDVMSMTEYTKSSFLPISEQWLSFKEKYNSLFDDYIQRLFHCIGDEETIILAGNNWIRFTEAGINKLLVDRGYSDSQFVRLLHDLCREKEAQLRTSKYVAQLMSQGTEASHNTINTFSDNRSSTTNVAIVNVLANDNRTINNDNRTAEINLRSYYKDDHVTNVAFSKTENNQTNVNFNNAPSQIQFENDRPEPVQRGPVQHFYEFEQITEDDITKIYDYIAKSIYDENHPFIKNINEGVFRRAVYSADFREIYLHGVKTKLYYTVSVLKQYALNNEWDLFVANSVGIDRTSMNGNKGYSLPEGFQADFPIKSK